MDLKPLIDSKSHLDLKSLTTVFWVAGMGLQGVLSLVLLGKKAWRHFPVFTSYSLSSFIATVSVYLLQWRNQPKLVVFYSFWIGEAITIILGFGVVYEIFFRLFSNHKALLKLSGMIFKWTVVALFCVAFSVILVQAPAASLLKNTVVVLDEATRVVEVGLLMFLFGASAAFGLHWKQAEFGIALGLGLFVAVELAGMTLRSQIGAHTAPSQWQVLNVVRSLAFDISLLVWLGYLLAPERVTTNVAVPKRAQLEQWNQAVTELISR
jgi:hypothetical protein